MSKSTTRKCAVCGEIAYGPNQNGRRNFGGSKLRGHKIKVGGVWVNAGAQIPVCEYHRDMVISARAMAAHGGTAARQEAEAAILNADEATQDAAADRAGRLSELHDAVWQTMNADELASFTKSARNVAWKAARGSMGTDVAFDDITKAFVDRVAAAAFRDVADDVPATEAVMSVDRGAELRGLGMVNMTRTSQTARTGSIDAAVSGSSPDGMDGGSMSSDALFALTNLQPESNAFGSTRDAYRVGGRTVGRVEFDALLVTAVQGGGATGQLAREIMRSRGMLSS